MKKCDEDSVDRQDFFFKFGRNQKIYDSFSNSWDLCKEFGKKDKGGFRWGDGYDSSDSEDDMPHASRPDHPEQDTFIPDDFDNQFSREPNDTNVDSLLSTEPDDSNIDGPLPSTQLEASPLETMHNPPKDKELEFDAWTPFIISTVNQPVVVHSMQDHVKATALDLPFLSGILRDRFGWHRPFGPCPVHPSLEKVTVIDKLFSDARRTFSTLEDHDDLDTAAVKRDFCNFAAFIGDLAEKDGIPPSPTWDLSPSNPHYLGNREIVVQITRIEFLINDKDIVFYKLEVPRASHEEGEEGEVDEDKENDWDLFVRDASTAVECLRRQFTCTKDIARTLLRQGSEFITAARGFRKVSSGGPVVDIPPMGWRNVDYKPDLGDFAAYKASVSLFLRQPQGRAAWKFGGLLWRIAQYFSDTGMNDGIYLDGPTTEDSSSSFEMLSSDGQRWEADALSKDEVDLLIGRYRVYTGR